MLFKLVFRRLQWDELIVYDILDYISCGALKVKSLSRVRLSATPWTVAYQASPSMGFSRQEYWSGLLFPSPGDLPNPGVEPRSPAWQEDSLPAEPQGKPKNTARVDYPFSRGSSWPRNWTGVSWIAGRFFTNWAIREALLLGIYPKNWKLLLTQILIWHRS